MNPHIKKAVDLFGGQTALAASCLVSQPAVRKWLHGGAISPESASAIERATKGAVRRQNLRPNDWHLIWPELSNNDGLPPGIAKKRGKAA